MGCSRINWQITSLIFSSLMLLFSTVHGSKAYDPLSLNKLIHDLAMKELVHRRTGTLFNVSLPANFSEIEVSAVRIRAGSFRNKGANFSNFDIPSKVVPNPSVTRLSIVYRNLGKCSSDYYKIPGYSLVAPVVGFLAYDASNFSALGNETLKFRVSGSPILVRFPDVKIEGKKGPVKCVKFVEGGFAQFRNLSKQNVCITLGDGHFSLAVPVMKGVKKWKWWAIGVAGAIGFVLLGVTIFTCCKILRSKRSREMEEQSEKGVAFRTTWIGRSRMPSASMVRTQAALEHGHAP